MSRPHPAGDEQGAPGEETAAGCVEVVGSGRQERLEGDLVGDRNGEEEEKGEGCGEEDVQEDWMSSVSALMIGAPDDDRREGGNVSRSELSDQGAHRGASVCQG